MSEITISEEARKAASEAQNKGLGFVAHSVLSKHFQLAINSATSPLQKKVEEFKGELVEMHEQRRQLQKRIEELNADLETWVARASGYVQEEQVHGTHRELAEKVESLERQLLAMREALTEFNIGTAFITEMRPGSEKAFVKAIQLYHEIQNSTPADLASKYSKREVLEKCAEAIQFWCDTEFSDEYVDRFCEALDLARKELETR